MEINNLDFGINNWIKKHPMIELIHVRKMINIPCDYNISLKNTDNSVYFQYKNLLSWPDVVRPSILYLDKLKEHFDKESFVILRYHTWSSSTPWIANFSKHTPVHDHLSLNDMQSNIFANRHSIKFKPTPFETERPESGIIIIFKNKEDMLLTKTTNFFGLAK